VDDWPGAVCRGRHQRFRATIDASHRSCLLRTLQTPGLLDLLQKLSHTPFNVGIRCHVSPAPEGILGWVVAQTSDARAFLNSREQVGAHRLTKLWIVLRNGSSRLLVVYPGWLLEVSCMRHHMPCTPQDSTFKTACASISVSILPTRRL
jgi:hypothetical protein